MCGIVAISSVRPSHFDVPKMLEAIRHRGPDGHGVFVSDKADCHLGHVRLSIIDLSPAGQQPMADVSGRFVISFNGEIYNFRELRRELDRAHGQIPWRSHSDTEVIVEGYAREGAAFLDRLNGIFALAIYDRAEELLCVLRDPLGVKPIFFTEQFGNHYFCSELKGLKVVPELRRTLRLEAFADQLAFMYVPEPHTLFEEFHKLEPGLLLRCRHGKRVSATKLFARLHAPVEIDSDEETISRFGDAFSTAVRRQLVSDAPISLMLSGGLDSSAIAQAALGGGSEIRDAFTISFSAHDLASDRQSDDLHFARMVAKRLGLHLEVIEAREDFIALLPNLIEFMEDGITDPAAINTWLISKAARERGVKVLLTGQGSDEFLGGYRRYMARRFLTRIGPLRVLLAAAGGITPRGIPGRYNALARRIHRAGDLARMSKHEQLLGMFTWAEPSRIRELFAMDVQSEIGRDLLAKFDDYKSMNDIEAMMRVDQHYDLMSLNLTYCDRMSMAAGVEARVPFLDFDLVQLMNSIPLGMKIRGFTGKYVLRKAMESKLPSEVVNREKAGFSLPIRSWLTGNNKIFNHYIDSERIARQGLFNATAVRRICDEQASGRGDWASVLMTILCIQIWLEKEGLNGCLR